MRFEFCSAMFFFSFFLSLKAVILSVLAFLVPTLFCVYLFCFPLSLLHFSSTFFYWSNSCSFHLLPLLCHLLHHFIIIIIIIIILLCFFHLPTHHPHPLLFFLFLLFLLLPLLPQLFLLLLILALLFCFTFLFLFLIQSFSSTLFSYFLSSSPPNPSCFEIEQLTGIKRTLVCYIYIQYVLPGGH